MTEPISHRAIARNYATEHANRIHSDETAARYGFAGGLVPGIALYAYLTDPLVGILGPAWLASGQAAVKFLKPVYDGAEVEVRIRAIDSSPPCFALELYDQAGILCSIAEAGLPDQTPPPSPNDYPFRPLPAPEDRREATLANVSKGDQLGSLEFTVDLAGAQRVFLDEVGSIPEIFREPEAFCHPAWLLAQANEILARNVVLGPWVHTGSEVRHYALAEDGETLSLRGRIIEAGEKRGHDFVTMDLGLFGREERAIAAIRHSALIRLREAQGSNQT
jgi:acyl dehydratase